MKRLIKLVGVGACILAIACGGTEKKDTTPENGDDKTPKGPVTQDKVYQTKDLGLTPEGP